MRSPIKAILRRWEPFKRNKVILRTEIRVQEQIYLRNVSLPESEGCAAWSFEQAASQSVAAEFCF